MSSNYLRFFASLLACAAPPALADSFQLSSTMTLRPGAPQPILQISTSGPAPLDADASRYRDKANWKALWQTDSDAVPTYVDVDSIELDLSTKHLIIHVSGAKLPAGDGRDDYWTAVFVPPAGMAAIPQVFSYAPRKGAGSGGKKVTLLAPVGSSDQPDLLLNGTFLAGGGTKPIYTLHEQASLYAPSNSKWNFHGFAPGFASEVWINQGAQPPNNRTRFDPDSIRAGLSLWRVDPIESGVLYGMTTQVNLIGGEFTRSDPSSNIMSGFLTTLVLRRKRLSESAFATLYPVLGLEGGYNLNHPDELSGTAVDLSHYGGIFRGVLGADSTLGIANSDRTSNVFAITGSYRVRLPATDEPFIRTVHGDTSVDLSTRARHWLEVDITYSPWQWKYLALNAKYTYGSLPPLFSLVDHQVSFGLLLQAKQNNKQALPGQ